MMMFYYPYSLVSLFFSSIYIYVSKYSHFLLMLLSLESVVLAMYLLIFIYINYFNYEYFLSMFFLTMTVCESALGLSLLVLLIRIYGKDSILSFDSLW